MVEAVSFVVPGYHEPVEVIRETVTSLLSAVDGMLTVEIIVVNDGNNAETFPVFTEQKIPDLNSGRRIFRKKIVRSYQRLFPKRFSITTTITMICLTNFYKVRYLDIP